MNGLINVSRTARTMKAGRGGKASGESGPSLSRAALLPHETAPLDTSYRSRHFYLP